MLIIVEPPGFDDLLGLGHRGELVYGHTSISQAAVTEFNTGILHRLAQANKVDLRTQPTDPIFERPRLELGVMIHRD